MATNMDVDLASSSPRGTKRKAEEQPQAPYTAPRRIRQLSEDVVNKIAAGEIIVAPVHALKELIENAVDAGSTALDVVVKDGGLKLLQISDNGCGINREDMAILCERFTTSKLKAFEDLQSIGTYGFRGEALASISHIAHLSVTTRTKESSCAWKAHYSDGKPAPPKPGQAAEPKAIAGKPGTQIVVEDLFYNIPTRRRAFRSPSEEYAKILDLVGRYSVHCEDVGFTCKKHGESSLGLSVSARATTVDRIRQVHGSAVANELVEIKCASDRWGFSAAGWVSNANYSVKRTSLLLFINHRSVESTPIKKAVEKTYAAFLPKGGHAFIYLSLQIDPKRVDVNVHPTKREVRFLNEEEIIDMVCDEIRLCLGRVDTSRTFMMQTLLPGSKVPLIRPAAVEEHEDDSPNRGSESTQRHTVPKPGSHRPYENNLVRVDAKSRKITTMLRPSMSRDPTLPDADQPDPWAEEMQYEYSDREQTLCRLTSVKELRAEVREVMHNELSDVFASHTFVGIVDENRRIAAIQGGVKLFLIDYGMVANEYFYQLGLTDFGNFGCIRLNPPLSLQELLEIAATHERTHSADADDVDWHEVVTLVMQQLVSSRDMLGEYFSLDVSAEGELLSLPLLMKGYLPNMAKLPRFLLRLGPHVDWNNEKACFHTFLRELASFYVPESLPPAPVPAAKLTGAQDGGGPVADTAVEEAEDPDIAGRRRQLNHALENIIFPAFKTRMVATKGLLKGVVEVANLKGLYRVFERC